MAAVAGIHFGNTNSCVAVCNDGRIDVVSNDSGDRMTPCMVAYTGDEKLVGLHAKQYWKRTPKSVVRRIKTTLGKSLAEEEAQSITDECQNCVREQDGSLTYRVLVDDKIVTVNPEKAAMYVMTKLLVDAESVGGSDLEDAVLTVPCSCTEKQSIALSEAAEESGFNILRVISEPAAALLAYGIGQDKSNDAFKTLTFRFGGTSCEAAVVEVNSGTYRIIHHETNTHCGCELLDKALVDSCIQDFRRQWKCDISENSRAVRKLTHAAEQCKHSLSNSNNTTCSAESLHEGIDFQTSITRAKFESLASPVFKDCFALVEKVLKNSSCTRESIAKVVLFGGGVKIPKVQSMFKEYFVDSEVHISINPDEILATGAAIEAGILQGKDDTFTNDSHYLDCIPRHICIETYKNGQRELVPLIDKMTPVPTKKMKLLETETKDTSICIGLYESDDIGVLKEAVCLGKIVLRNLQKPELKLSFSAEYKRDGTLRVLVEEKTNGQTEVLLLEPTA